MRRPTVGQAVVALVVTAGLVRIGLVVGHLSSRHLNEDQASVLLAAQELLRGQVHQPSFPGQSYGVVFEGLGAAAGSLVGIPPVVGLTATLALLWYAGWVVVAAGAWDAGARATGLLAAAAPLLLAVYPVYYASVFTVGLGRLLGVVAAVLLWRRRWVPLGVGAGALAVVFDPSSVLLPVVGALLAGRALVGAVRAQWLSVAFACQPALAWAAWRRWFAVTHPDHVLHAAPSVDPSWSGLTEVVTRGPHYAGSFSLAVLPGGWPVLVLVALVFLACLLLGGWQVRAAAVALAALTALIAATPRALDDVSPFLPGSRVFLAVPYAVVLLAAAVEPRLVGQRLRSAVLPVAAAVVLVSACAGAVRWQSSAGVILAAAATAPVVPLVPEQEMEQRCRAARELGTELVVFLDDRAAAYGCPVLLDDAPATLLPAYERRTWRLYEEADEVRGRVAVVGNAELCGTATAVGLVCRPAPGSLPAVVVEPAGMSSLQALRALGVFVRPFGPGCVPERPETCVQALPGGSGRSQGARS
ncbi:MAG: hypothetical protein EPN99_00665 [Frankiales bacterium]|nr:MAG: hypothetical protein EPN99_00665 [Frankiales bacterium]